MGRGQRYLRRRFLTQLFSKLISRACNEKSEGDARARNKGKSAPLANGPLSSENISPRQGLGSVC